MRDGTIADAMWRRCYRVGFRLLKAYWFFRRPRHVGAGVALWHGDSVLLVRTSYRPTVSVPAGSLSRGEAPREAALRELGEEVAVILPDEALTFVGVFAHEANWMKDRFHLFEVRLDERPEVRIDRREIVWAGFVPREEALALPLAAPVRRYLNGASPDGDDN